MSKSIRKAEGKRLLTPGPIVTLIFISPILAELLMGIVHLSNLWLLVPEMSVYGTAALLVREVTRRKRRSWDTMLLLGIAFAIVDLAAVCRTVAFEENFGWAFGVQWIYLTAMLWYESVYAIVLPIYITEMLFPTKRDELWLNERGVAVTVGIFVLASIGVWQLWTHVGLPHYSPNSYQVPPLYILTALIVSILMVAGILLRLNPSRPINRTNKHAPRPWLVWLMAFGFGLAWFYLIALAFVPATTVNGASPLIPIGGGLVWIGLGLIVVQRISSAVDWDDRQRLALIFGASVASMLGGVLFVLADQPIDIISKFVFDLITVGLFIWFATRIRKREMQSKTDSHVYSH